MRSVIAFFLAAHSVTWALSSDVGEIIRAAALRSGLDPLLIHAMVQVESNYQPYATSAKGAMGLMQIMPQNLEECEIHDPYHSLDNLMGACVCLRRLINYYRGNLKLALAAYNAGARKVDEYRDIPPFPETQKYVKKIIKLYDSLRRS